MWNPVPRHSRLLETGLHASSKMKTAFVCLLAIAAAVALPKDKRDKRQFLTGPVVTDFGAHLAEPVFTGPAPVVAAAPAQVVAAAPAQVVAAAPAQVVAAAPAQVVAAAPAQVVAAAPAPIVAAAPAPVVAAAPAIAPAVAAAPVVAAPVETHFAAPVGTHFVAPFQGPAPSYFAPGYGSGYAAGYTHLAAPLVSKTVISPFAADAPLFY